MNTIIKRIYIVLPILAFYLFTYLAYFTYLSMKIIFQIMFIPLIYLRDPYKLYQMFFKNYSYLFFKTHHIQTVQRSMLHKSITQVLLVFRMSIFVTSVLRLQKTFLEKRKNT